MITYLFDCEYNRDRFLIHEIVSVDPIPQGFYRFHDRIYDDLNSNPIDIEISDDGMEIYFGSDQDYMAFKLMVDLDD